MPTKILVTGAAGFVGSAIAEKLAENNTNFVVGVDNFLTGSPEKIPTSPHNNMRFIKADANNYKDISSIFFANEFDYVFHYAAVVGVLRTLDNPVMVLEDLDGIKNVLDLSKNTGVKRIYFSSSSEVYGEPVEFPQNEHTTPLNSRLPYAIVKNIGEAFLRAYKQEFNLDFTIFRFFNTYGPKQSTDFVMSKFIYAALQGKDITIYGDGSQSRTFCYVDDNIEASVNAFYKGIFVNDVLNIGNDNETTILELAQTIIKITKSNSKIVHLPALKDGDMTRRLPDNTKMRQLLGKELTTLEDGIQKLLNAWGIKIK
ncbi:MAG: NAD-dependent epimerase/dehydratase family protein [Bacteroidetes bacterium]|nr:NAD-dependent epimerase/dehydratase family protein [Bacteroidota bacterium]HNR18709.1 NAD-dependent epimerase/dehydratase family protein [Bacteroidia bacterium]HNU33365.1 NAD-dependent epimerase/dehydratase family protein [Bacteroidia bacterium]